MRTNNHHRVEVTRINKRSRPLHPQWASALNGKDEDKRGEEASVSVVVGATPQLTVRFSRSLWRTIKSPLRLDVIGKVEKGLKLVSGSGPKVQMNPSDPNHVTIAIAASKLGLDKKKRSSIKVRIAHVNGCLLLDSIPADWGVPPPEPAPAPEPQKTILVGTTAEKSPAQQEWELKLVVVIKHGTTHCMRFTIPSALFGAIGDPERVVLSGTPREGMMMTPTPVDGLKVQYNEGINIFMDCGLRGRDLTKHCRERITLKATVENGAIKIAPAEAAWVNCEPQYVPAAKPQAPAASEVRHIDPSTYTPPEPPAPTATGDPDIAELKQMIYRMRVQKKKIEEKFGVPLKMTSNFQVYLDI